MPSFRDQLSQAEVDAILDYIKTSWRESDRAIQADISERYQAALDSQQ